MHVSITPFPFSVELWQSFLTTAAVDKLKSSLQQGDFSKAAYIWTTSLVSLHVEPIRGDLLLTELHLE